MKCSLVMLVCALSLGSVATARNAVGDQTPAQTPAAAPAAIPDSLNVAPDTTFLAKLTTPVAINQTKKDDVVEAQTTQDIKQGHDVLLKKGSILSGHVTSVQPPNADKPECYVVIAFDRVKVKGGDEKQLDLIIQALAPEAGSAVGHDIADSTGTQVQSATRNAGVSGHAASTMGNVSPLDGTSKGVYGMQGLQVGDRITSGKHYTVLAASQKDIQLKKNTQLVMKVVGQ